MTASGPLPSPADRRPEPAPDQRLEPKLVPSRRWHSTDLFGAQQEIEIEHGAAVYRLRRTSLGKLILTK